MSDQVRLLCTGDLHIGRFPSHVPVQNRALSVESAWGQAVTLAIDERVDAVVLTGDVADQDNKLFEALGPLRTGVARLWEAGIRTVAVAGNHDYDVLRRLAGLVDEAFTLLGPEGTWSETVLERDGRPVLRLVGWSFPARHVRTSPLASFPTFDADLPAIGVVHGDLDQEQSDYAPLRRADLAAAPVDAWLLGHVHKPMRADEGGTLLLYPGSLQPLDPGEKGAHGPWIVTLEPDGSVSATHRPAATVRYEQVGVDLSGVDTKEGAEAALTQAVDARLAALCAEQPGLVQAVVDVHLTGRTALFSDLPTLASAVTGQSFPSPSAVAVVRRVSVDARPAYDLDLLADQKDPAGAAARLILNLEADAEAVRGLLDEAVRSNQILDAAPAFAPLKQAPHAPADPRASARDTLVEQGLRFLDALMTQTSSN